MNIILLNLARACAHDKQQILLLKHKMDATLHCTATVQKMNVDGSTGFPHFLEIKFPDFSDQNAPIKIYLNADVEKKKKKKK